MPGSFPLGLQELAPRTAVPTARSTDLLYEQTSHMKLLFVFRPSVPPYTITYEKVRGGTQAQLTVPAGTHVVGICAQGEPTADCYHLLGEHYAWVIVGQDVTVTVLDADYPLVNAQNALAEEHEQQASEHFERKNYRMAQHLYDIASVELIAANGSLWSISRIQMNRVIALVKEEAASELITSQLEQVASTYELALAEGGPSFYGEQIAVAEEASQVQVFLARQYASSDESQKAFKSVERLLELNKLIKKRYQSKVELLLHAAEILLQLEDSVQAAKVVANADRFFQQQLVSQTSYNDDVKQLGQRLERLKAQGSVSAHDISFVMTADTRDDLETILAALRGMNLDGLVFPKTVRRVQKGKSVRHGYIYTAKMHLKRSANQE